MIRTPERAVQQVIGRDTRLQAYYERPDQWNPEQSVRFRESCTQFIKEQSSELHNSFWEFAQMMYLEARLENSLSNDVDRDPTHRLNDQKQIVPVRQKKRSQSDCFFTPNSKSQKTYHK